MKKTPKPPKQYSSLIGQIDALRDWQALLRDFVECESPSHSKPLVDAFGRRVSEHFAILGGTLKRHAQRELGDVLQFNFKGDPARRPLLLLGHIDTVYEHGTLSRMPCRISGGKMYGPGVFDMKGGIVMMLLAIQSLQQSHELLPRPITILLNPDEEIGSRASRAITERIAKKCGAALVLEPSAGPKGACKTARKGVGHYLIRVTGISAHA